jgi:hypothetical protein
MVKDLVIWLDRMLLEFRPFTYGMYASDTYDLGLAPLTKAEFSYYIWWADRNSLIDPSETWKLEKHIDQRWDGENVTSYFWTVIDHFANLHSEVPE